jgi:acetolactate decarboxylase
LPIKHIFKTVLFLVAVSLLVSCSIQSEEKVGLQQYPDKDQSLFQVSTFNAFYAGNYDGSQTISQLEEHGDFGVGVIDQLDGELIGVDGVFYQVKLDGKALVAPGQIKTPYAIVTFFHADESIAIEEGPLKFAALKKSLDRLIHDKSHFYAIRIDGEFASVKIRSVPAQKKPYRRLASVVKIAQKIQELEGVKGTMVGFWFPRYISGINVPGYHFHFITEDRSRGGHLLDCRLVSGFVHCDHIQRIHLELVPFEYTD